MEMTMEKPRTSGSVQHTDIKRGEIWMVDLGSEGKGSEQKFVRPCAISQNNRGNFYSPCTQVIPLTTKEAKAKLPTHVQLYAEKTNLNYNSVALVEQQRVISKERLMYKIGNVDLEAMKNIGKAMIIEYELTELFYN